MKRTIVLTVVLILFLISIADGQSGGNYVITQAVVAAGGGQNSAGGNFSLDGTIGQSLAGNSASGASFSVTAGFWNQTGYTPTAASANVSGRVTTAEGKGIRNAFVRLTRADGTAQTAVTGSFGFFNFQNVPADETCVFTVSAKHFTFSQPTVVLTITDNFTDLNFVADF